MLFKLLALPVTLPAAGIRYCLQKVAEVAEAEMNSEEPLKAEILELHLALEEGRISEAQYRGREAVLLARLRELRERQRELAREQAQPEGEGDARVHIEIPEELR